MSEPRKRRRWASYSLRSLFVLVTALGVLFGWVSWRLRFAAQQRAAVAAIREMRGSVVYSNWIGGGPPVRRRGPDWGRFNRNDFFHDVVEVHPDHVTDELLACVSRLPRVQKLDDSTLEGSLKKWGPGPPKIWSSCSAGESPTSPSPKRWRGAGGEGSAAMANAVMRTARLASHGSRCR